MRCDAIPRSRSVKVSHIVFLPPLIPQIRVTNLATWPGGPFRHTDDTEPCCKSAKVSIEGCDRYQSSANVSSPFCKDCSNWLTSTEDTKQISQIATWNMRNIKKASKMQRHGQLPSFSFIRPHSFMDNSIPFGLHCKFPQELTQGWTQRVVDCTCPTALSTQQPYELTESTMWLNSVKLNSVWLCISAT